MILSIEPLQRVGFLHHFGLKKSLDLAHFGPELGVVYEGTAVLY